MHLDSVNVDCRDPRRMADFWAAGLDLPQARTGDGGVALALPGNGLELWFLPVTDHEALADPRVHFDLDGEHRRDEIAAQLEALGAAPLDIGQGDVPWTVLADPEGHPFCVIPDRPQQYRQTGRLASLPYDCADVARTMEFWRRATGWVEHHVEGRSPMLQHPSRTGVLLTFCEEQQPKTPAKNGLHLDLRLDPGEDEAEAVARLVEWGARVLDHGWGELDWTVLTDPSGNEFCLLRP